MATIGGGIRPDLAIGAGGGRDYSSFLFDAMSSIGNVVRQNRQDAFQREESGRDYARALDQDEYARGRDLIEDEQFGQRLALDERRYADALTPKPTFGTIYDDQGNEQKAWLTPGQEPVPVGGRKAATGPARLTATDRKAIFEAEDEFPAVQGTIEVLDRALELNDKAATGYTAGARGTIGSNLPDAAVPDWLIDRETAEATREFGQIMSSEAITAMSQTLKGATTDRELAEFQRILSDPSTPPPIRKRTIERMRLLAQRKAQIMQSRIRELKGGTYYEPDSSLGGGQAALSPEQQAIAQDAVEAIEQGADPERIKPVLIENGIDPAMLGIE